MQFPNEYHYGALMGFSGLEGDNPVSKDFSAQLMHEPISLRFCYIPRFRYGFTEWITLKIPVSEHTRYQAVMGDFIEGESDGQPVLIAFMDNRTVAGLAPVEPSWEAEAVVSETVETKAGVETRRIHTDFQRDFLLSVKRANNGFLFSFAVDTKAAPRIYSEAELRACIQNRYAYYAEKPVCKHAEYEKLYYKCLSINRVNVYTGELPIACRWTTPDRFPHKMMWLWDSAFHAMSFMQYDVEMAKDCVRALFAMQREDGFIASMLAPYYQSEFTQPQVLAWTVWNIYCKDGDKAFLEECVEPLKKYLLWDATHRDRNDNGLLEWATEEDKNCKCGESGLDNSPRFDFDENMDAIDFSCYQANDCKYLAKICRELGDEEDYAYFHGQWVALCDKINELTWDEEDGLYYDRLFDGRLTKVKTASSFLPLFVGIATKERAARLVQNLLDEETFWTEMPLPSIAKNHPAFNGDMWRGGTWLNIDYFMILGLKKYGYEKEAAALREKVLQGVLRWFDETGCIYEFYDALGKTPPAMLKRKGDPVCPHDYKLHLHSVSDFNWSACFTALLINEIYMQ